MADLFDTLREMMLRSAAGMVVRRDDPQWMEMDAPWPNPRRPSEPMWFGGVRQGKAYVSVHLMPVYVDPSLLGEISPALKKRMQGKSCFNFKAIDPDLLQQLEALTARAAAAFAVSPEG